MKYCLGRLAYWQLNQVNANGWKYLRDTDSKGGVASSGG